MAFSLYDVSVGTYLQLIQGAIAAMDKGAAFFNEQGLSADEFVNERLSDDMLPFEFQIRSIAHHSLGCLHGLEAGLFSPPPEEPKLSYMGLRDKLVNVKKELEAYAPETVNSLSGKAVLFKMGDFELPFVSDSFVLSFSLPNFYFHTTTAYALLRKRGVKLGKVDYLGPMKFQH